MLLQYSNKADLAIINRIRAQLNPSGRSALGQLSPVVRSQQKTITDGSVAQQGHDQQQKASPLTKLQRVLHAVRFTVRMQIGARNWAKHEKVRQRLADCVEEMEREERIKKMRNQWRAEHHVQPQRNTTEYQRQPQGQRHIQVQKRKNTSSRSAGAALVRRNLDLGDLDEPTT